MTTLKKKVVVVTGASSGIGASLATIFSQRGARVVLAARRKKNLDAVAKRCSGHVLIVPSDLVKKKDRKMLVERTMTRWGQIDILINNAGMGAYGHFGSSTETDWRHIFEINLFAAVFLTKSVIPIMVKQDSGMIINIASIGGLVAHSDKVAHYVASKHALVGFSRALAKDYHGCNIRILAACPHLTDTDFFSRSKGSENLASVANNYRKYMDSPDDVSEGIIEQLDSDRVVIFPTEKPKLAFDKLRDI